MRDLLRKWWFYPLAIAYLLFGVWFAGLNFRVYERPDDYVWGARYFLFPVSTALRDGFVCETNKQTKTETCLVKGGRSYGENALFATGAKNLFEVDYSLANYTKQVYGSVMAIFWGPKILVNLLLIVLCVFFWFYAFIVAVVLPVSIAICMVGFDLLIKLIAVLS